VGVGLETDGKGGAQTDGRWDAIRIDYEKMWQWGVTKKRQNPEKSIGIWRYCVIAG